MMHDAGPAGYYIIASTTGSIIRYYQLVSYQLPAAADYMRDKTYDYYYYCY
jgi:hypothetical protein